MSLSTLELKNPRHGLAAGDLVAGTIRLIAANQATVFLDPGFGIISTHELSDEDREIGKSFVFKVDNCRIGSLPKLTFKSLEISSAQNQCLLNSWLEKQNKKKQECSTEKNDAPKLAISLKDPGALLQPEDFVVGVVSGHHRNFGVFVDVGEKKGLIHRANLPEDTLTHHFEEGSRLIVKVLYVRADGKLNLGLVTASQQLIDEILPEERSTEENDVPEPAISLKDSSEPLHRGDCVVGQVSGHHPYFGVYVDIGNKKGLINQYSLPEDVRSNHFEVGLRLIVKVLDVNQDGKLILELVSTSKKFIDKVLSQNGIRIDGKPETTIDIKNEWYTLQVGDFVACFVDGHATYGVFVKVGDRKGLVHKTHLPEDLKPQDFVSGQHIVAKVIGVKGYDELALDLISVPRELLNLPVRKPRKTVNVQTDQKDLINVHVRTQTKTVVDHVAIHSPEEVLNFYNSDDSMGVLSPYRFNLKLKKYRIKNPFTNKICENDCVVAIISQLANNGIYVYIGNTQLFIEHKNLLCDTDIEFLREAQPILFQYLGQNQYGNHYFSQTHIPQHSFQLLITYLEESGNLRKAILSYKEVGIKANLTLAKRIRQKLKQCSADTTSTVPEYYVSRTLFKLVSTDAELSSGDYVLAKIKSHLWYGASLSFGHHEGVVYAGNDADFSDYSDDSLILLRYLENTKSGKRIFTRCQTQSVERQPLERLADVETDVLFVGPTGVGKSSIINAILCLGSQNLIDVTTVGHGFATCTDHISPYKYKKLTLWDSPGLGESPEADKKTIKLINHWIKDHKNQNIVLAVAYDAYSRDCHSTFALLESLEEKVRVVHVINRVDMLLRGQFWNDKCGYPMKQTLAAINEKIESIKTRTTAIAAKNHQYIAVCAGFNNEFDTRQSYNIDKLIETISNKDQKQGIKL